MCSQCSGDLRRVTSQRDQVKKNSRDSQGLWERLQDDVITWFIRFTLRLFNACSELLVHNLDLSQEALTHTHTPHWWSEHDVTVKLDLFLLSRKDSTCSFSFSAGPPGVLVFSGRIWGGEQEDDGDLLRVRFALLLKLFRLSCDSELWPENPGVIWSHLTQERESFIYVACVQCIVFSSRIQRLERECVSVWETTWLCGTAALIL